MERALLIAPGGALGTLLGHLTSGLTVKRLRGDFPYGALIASRLVGPRGA